MNMGPGSWHIYRVSNFERDDGLSYVYLTANMLEIGCEWPPIIYDDELGKSFKFESNEVMKDWMIGKYSGHAKYVEIV